MQFQRKVANIAVHYLKDDQKLRGKSTKIENGATTTRTETAKQQAVANKRCARASTSAAGQETVGRGGAGKISAANDGRPIAVLR